MSTKDILLLGLKGRVTAVSKSNGRQLWSTRLEGGMGNGFVTLLCEDSRVFAYANGHLHCLDLASGTMLWRNDLPGLGYGIGALCLPDGDSAPNPAVVKQIRNAQAAASSANSAAG
jgi:outer membrane protein assembly factor BamB